MQYNYCLWVYHWEWACKPLFTANPDEDLSLFFANLKSVIPPTVSVSLQVVLILSKNRSQSFYYEEFLEVYFIYLVRVFGRAQSNNLKNHLRRSEHKPQLQLNIPMILIVIGESRYCDVKWSSQNVFPFLILQSNLHFTNYKIVLPRFGSTVLGCFSTCKR